MTTAMEKVLLLSYPGQEAFSRRLAEALEADWATLQLSLFPGGESLLTLPVDVKGRDVLLVCALNQPDPKLLPLLLAADCARDLGAVRVGLVAPYLAYLRQDQRFHPREAISSRTFAAVLSAHFDWLATVEPHLHRYASLADIFRIPVIAVSAAAAIAEWIRHEVKRPVIVGPDQESEPWVAAVAHYLDVPHTVLTKIRHDAYHVDVSPPPAASWQGRTPVLVDDIIETGRTLMAAVASCLRAGSDPPVCVAVHALFAGSAYTDLVAVGAANVVTCDTIAHDSNAISVAGVLAAALHEYPRP